MQLVPSQMDQHLRAHYITDVSLYGVDTLIFIDETDCNRRDTLRRYGYGVRGKPIRCHVTCSRKNFCDCSYDGEWDFGSSDC